MDTDPWMEQEAIDTERLDADIEMAELARAANAAEYQRRRGICQHSSAVGFAGQVHYPEQQGLKAGQQACTEHTGGCQAVFESDEAWYAAMDAAREGR